MCRNQMSDTEAIIPDFEREWGEAPPAVGSSFDHLAIIYERQGDLENAISVCKQGIEIGLSRPH